MTGPRMGVPETALYLGYSERHIYRLAEHRELPCYRKGRRLSFYRDELDAWIASGKLLTVDEMKKKADAILDRVGL
jgi:excisionase family DNA binding protein